MGKVCERLWYGYLDGGGALLTFFFLKSVERPTVAIPDPLVVVFRVGRSGQEQHRREWVRCAPVIGALTASSGREVAQRVDEKQAEGNVDRDEVHPGQGEVDSFDPASSFRVKGMCKCERIRVEVMRSEREGKETLASYRSKRP